MKILVADGHPFIRLSAITTLRKSFPRWTFVEADNLESLLARLREMDVDIIVTDLFLPGMGGPDGVRRLTAEGSGPPVVIFSSSQDPFDLWNAIRNGAKGYILKNAGAEEFVYALKMVSSGKTYLSPNAAENRSARDKGDTRSHGGLSPAANRLPPRQMEILQHLAQGETNKEIARNLGILESTVKVQLKSIFRALNVKNRTQAAITATRTGLLTSTGTALPAAPANAENRVPAPARPAA